MKKYRRIAFLLISLLFWSYPTNSVAVENGVLISRDENAVYLLDGSPNAFLYKPQIAFTAAHGYDDWGKQELFIYTSSGLKVKVSQVLIAKGFMERSVSREAILAGNTVSSRSNDFAILILSEPIAMSNNVELIKQDQLSEIVKSKEPVYSIGYSYFDSTRVRDQRPRKLESVMIDKEYAQQIYDKYYSSYHPNWGPVGSKYELSDIQVSHSKTNGSICDGDSGSGYFLQRGDTKIYLGPVGSHSVGTPNCGKPGYWGEHGNVFAIEPVYKHLDLIKQAEAIVDKMLAESMITKPTQEIEYKYESKIETVNLIKIVEEQVKKTKISKSYKSIKKKSKKIDKHR